MAETVSQDEGMSEDDIFNFLGTLGPTLENNGIGELIAQGKEARHADFKRPDFITKRQRGVIEKLFSYNGATPLPSIYTAEEFLRFNETNKKLEHETSISNVLFKFRLNGKLCFANLVKDGGYDGDEMPYIPLERIFKGAKLAFENVTEGKGWFPMDFSHRELITPWDLKGELEKIYCQDSISENTLGLCFYCSTYYGRNREQQVQVRIFLNKDAVQTIAEPICPREKFVDWKGSYNAAVLLGGFHWSDDAEIKTGDVVTLESLAGSPVPIVKDGKIAARAEILVVEGNFALHIVELAGDRPAAGTNN